MQLVISIRHTGMNHKTIRLWVAWDRNCCVAHCQKTEPPERPTVNALPMEPMKILRNTLTGICALRCDKAEAGTPYLPCGVLWQRSPPPLR